MGLPGLRFSAPIRAASPTVARDAQNDSRCCFNETKAASS
jgi:hypothetical protein